MSATALNLRSPHFESIPLTAPSAGYTAGQIVKVGEVVVVVVETKASAGTTAGIYKCEKIVLKKTAGEAWTLGCKLYFDSSAASLTTTASGNTLCARCNVAAAASDTSGEVSLAGNIAA